MHSAGKTEQTGLLLESFTINPNILRKKTTDVQKHDRITGE